MIITFQADHEPPIVVLKVNIPLLAGRVPPGWTVSLVDNPGFGEAKEHVGQLDAASLVTSSAYIYLLQTENIGGTEAADFFKELIRKDKGNNSCTSASSPGPFPCSFSIFHSEKCSMKH